MNCFSHRFFVNILLEVTFWIVSILLVIYTVIMFQICIGCGKSMISFYLLKYSAMKCVGDLGCISTQYNLSIQSRWVVRLMPKTFSSTRNKSLLLYRLAPNLTFYRNQFPILVWYILEFNFFLSSTSLSRFFFSFLFPLSFFIYFFIYKVSWGGVRLSSLGMSATIWHIIPVTDDRWWLVWSNRWNENWQEKSKYSEKTYPIATFTQKSDMTWPRLEPMLPLWELGNKLWHSLLHRNFTRCYMQY
jgi:hypothetical protein